MIVFEIVTYQKWGPERKFAWFEWTWWSRGSVQTIPFLSETNWWQFGEGIVLGFIYLFIFDRAEFDTYNNKYLCFMVANDHGNANEYSAFFGSWKFDLVNIVCMPKRGTSNTFRTCGFCGAQEKQVICHVQSPCFSLRWFLNKKMPLRLNFVGIYNISLFEVIFAWKCSSRTQEIKGGLHMWTLHVRPPLVLVMSDSAGCG